jgi:hypothetical protein
MKRFYAPLSMLATSLLYLSFVLPINTLALTGSPASQNVAANGTINVVLTSSMAADGATIRLSISNATVTGFTPPTGFSPIGVLGVCTPDPDNDFFTANTICFDISEPITNGRNLGTITLQVGTASPATITKADGNGYIVTFGPPNVFQDDTGVLGTYTISSVTNTPMPTNTTAPGVTNTVRPTVSRLPDTNFLTDGLSRGDVLFIGIIITSLGALLFGHQYFLHIIFPKSYEKHFREI